MIGKTVSHYRILGKLGEGGMGVVYKAEDSKLKRICALKFLKPNALARDEDRKRFIQEAQAAAALDHPNICTVYEINETEEQAATDLGGLFISMAYLKGQTVKEKLAKVSFELKEALEVAIQAGQGLQDAHENGIVHRDIKSANIMVTEKGQIRIMDFGLAQLADTFRLTKTGTTLGTPAYMSPEQVDGKKTDSRTDIYSLGVVLYEMVTGELPFQGENDLSIMYAILKKSPQPIKKFSPKIPAKLQNVINKALEKDSALRYQTMSEFIADLQSIKNGLQPQFHHIPLKKRLRSIPVRNVLVFIFVVAIALTVLFGYNYFSMKFTKLDTFSIAVMNFDNLSNDQNLDSYRKSVAKLIISNLSNETKLKVVASEDINRFVEKEKQPGNQQISFESALKIARKLKVGTLIMGSYFRTNEFIRFQINLCDVNKGIIYATENEEINQEDNFFFHIKELSQRIKIYFKIARNQEKDFIDIIKDENLDILSIKSIEAVQNYLIGLTAFSNRDHTSGIQFMNKAIEIDSSFTDVYWALINGMRNRARYKEAYDVLSKAEKFLKEGSSKDKAMYKWLDEKRKNDYKNCAKALRELILIEPNSDVFLYELGYYYNKLKKPELAIGPLTKVYNMKAGPHFLYYQLGNAYHKTQQYGKEFKVYKEGIKRRPDYAVLYALIARDYYRRGKIKKEAKAIQRMVDLTKEGVFDLPTCYSDLGYVYMDDEYFDRAEEFYKQCVNLDTTDAFYRLRLTTVYVRQNKWQEVINELQKCLEFDPNFAPAFYWMGTALDKLNKPKQAIIAYEQYLKYRTTEDQVTEVIKRIEELKILE